mmetsp:Transcript_28328/g.79970  ORF Transcript_28328/g.79970 Transcript_28328/m.79970 type:complete len:304 (-) Transcript_28328:1573-2484(-)
MRHSGGVAHIDNGAAAREVGAHHAGHPKPRDLLGLKLPVPKDCAQGLCKPAADLLGVVVLLVGVQGKRSAEPRDGARGKDVGVVGAEGPVDHDTAVVHQRGPVDALKQGDVDVLGVRHHQQLRVPRGSDILHCGGVDICEGGIHDAPVLIRLQIDERHDLHIGQLKVDLLCKLLHHEGRSHVPFWWRDVGDGVHRAATGHQQLHGLVGLHRRPVDNARCEGPRKLLLELADELLQGDHRRVDGATAVYALEGLVLQPRRQHEHLVVESSAVRQVGDLLLAVQPNHLTINNVHLHLKPNLGDVL